MPITLDMTMNLVNRTAVYEIGHAISTILPPGSAIRYWRFFRESEIKFDTSKATSTIGKVVGRAAFKDYDRLAAHWPWPRYANQKMLFLDPLFCGRTQVCEGDIVLCHDLGPITNPEYYGEATRSAYLEAYSAIRDAAPRIVFVSDYTRRRFAALFGGHYRATDTIPLYAKADLSNVVATPARRRARPFFLAVGALDRRKNFGSAIAAFVESGLARQGYDLVIVGPKGNAADEVLLQAEKASSVEYLGFVSTPELKQLYETAEALLFPSLLEGFGLPALEAGIMGKIPIVSSGTVLEEVVGPGAISVDPTSIASMANGLKLAATMDDESKARRLALIASHQAGFTKEAFHSRWAALLADEATGSGPK